MADERATETDAHRPSEATQLRSVITDHGESLATVVSAAQAG